MKTLVKMKSTQNGKDDDSALTVRYNEGGEYLIGQELLTAFKDMDAVTILDGKKKESSKKTKEAPAEVESSEEECEEEEETEEEKPKKKRKKSK